jgi:ABC-type sugar transport system substrate-binding protein
MLDIAYPSLRPCLLRSEGFFAGLQSVLPGAQLVERVNGEAMVDVSSRLSKQAFKKHPDINIVFGMDDESIHGGLLAVKEMGLDEEKLLLVGFGMAGDEDKDILMQGGCWRASVAMFPEWVGLRCVDQAVRLFNGEKVKTHDVTPTLAVTKENLPNYYFHTDNVWIPNFKTIAGITLENKCSRS